jgi:iron complex transport system substrate-binding protein
MMKKRIVATIVIMILIICTGTGCIDNTSAGSETENPNTVTITDSLGREVEVPENPERVVAQGPGALRYQCYLHAQDKVVGVESIELREDENRRPYRIANPQLKNKPLIGEYRGNTDPEKIVSVNPEVIFWTYVTSPDDADKLQQKTGVPVVALNYGTLGVHRNEMYKSLRIMGDVLNKEERSEDVIQFFNKTIKDLNKRTNDIPEDEKRSVYIGGIAYKGPHGYQSTEPAYPPFEFINAKNVASGMGTDHADASKEAIIEWDPDILFVDLSTYDAQPSAVEQLKTDPVYRSLTAVEEGEVYGVLPYNWYTKNYGTVLANAYYIGTVIYPERFNDIDPEEKANKIYEFLVSEPVYKDLEKGFGCGYEKIPVN